MPVILGSAGASPSTREPNSGPEGHSLQSPSFDTQDLQGSSAFVPAKATFFSSCWHSRPVTELLARQASNWIVESKGTPGPLLSELDPQARQACCRRIGSMGTPGPKSKSNFRGVQEPPWSRIKLRGWPANFVWTILTGMPCVLVTRWQVKLPGNSGSEPERLKF